MGDDNNILTHLSSIDRFIQWFHVTPDQSMIAIFLKIGNVIKDTKKLEYWAWFMFLEVKKPYTVFEEKWYKTG